MPARFHTERRRAPLRRLLGALAASLGVGAGMALAAEPADTVIAIARFTVWPDDVEYGLSFRICLRHDDPAIASFLDRRGTSIQGRPISLHSVKPAQFGEEPCHAAYFSAGLADRAIIEKISLRPVLTVSPQKGFAVSGGVVEVADPDADDRLLVSDATLARSPLRLRAPLLEVAGRAGE
ncbi:MAG: YfiR family protein [Pseudomonadota bacterium]